LTLDGYNRQIGNGIIASIIDITSKVNTRTTEETTKKRKAFEAKHGSLEEMLTKIRFNVWDIITIDEYYAKSSKTPYNIRFNELISKTEGLSMVSVVESVIVKSYSEAINHFKKLLALGKEGTILKVYDSHWIDGKHSHAIKFKLEMDVDLRIVGYNYGTVGSKNEHVISSIKAQSSDGLLNTQPQGLTEDRMQYITENQDLLLGSIIQVRCNGTSKNVDGDYSLMYPRLIEFRSDKDTCDSLESILQIENMVKELS
jgi:DNA ligase-1